MEGRSARQVAVIVLLLAASLWAQPPAPAGPVPLNARDLAALVEETAPLFPSLAANRERILQGFTPEIYALVLETRARAVRSALETSNTAAADRAKLLTIADRWDAHLRAVLARNEQRLRNADRDNLARYAESDRVLPAPAAGEQRVVFMGDSITDGWRLADYFPGKPYVNRGIGGQITGEMLGRMKADVLDLKPVAMTILGGTNDLARGVAVQTVENNLTMMALLAKASGIKVILASILPVNTERMIAVRPPDKILEINKWMQEFAAKEGFLYLNYFDALKNEQGLLRSDLSNDGLHPHAAGYKIMAPLVQAAIDQALKGATARKKK